MSSIASTPSLTRQQLTIVDHAYMLTIPSHFKQQICIQHRAEWTHVRPLALIEYAGVCSGNVSNRACVQLAQVFTGIFNLSLAYATAPHMPKDNILVSNPLLQHDWMTSPLLYLKCFDELVFCHLNAGLVYTDTPPRWVLLNQVDRSISFTMLSIWPIPIYTTTLYA